ncbi:GNAT family N-acetyltransferase [Hazenella coriacea]|uniref:Acetyltransferase (GNAT) family protein n=1 Tax=Hazenella coriacea TaxID=1179467 RepID=A0A4R3L7L9_9BACL|nr:GNAT family N-acetyltransferase [Hazenella coriacea]TCS95108.1 acetyltransferase (GNAT) family protein [Hazenella coriacea]
MNFIYRVIKPSDSVHLKEFLYLAIQAPVGEQKLSENVDHPELSRYLENWGQSGDLGFFAVEKKEKKPVGAAWFRQFSKEKPGYGFVSEKEPEITIAILPEYRRQGLGRDLLTRLINQARLEGYPGLSLHVAKDHPAVRFYERLAFEVIRSEGSAQVMRRAL